jgi:hypothetical protein
MSLIRVPVTFVGSTGEKILYALFDSGANISCINSEFVGYLGEVVTLGRTRRLATASDNHFMEIKEAILLDFTVNDVALFDDFLVVPGLSEEVIIGASTLQKWRIKLDFEHEVVIVDPKVAKLQLL